VKADTPWPDALVRHLRPPTYHRPVRLSDQRDVVVVGAGGLSVARALANGGRRVLVVEREVAAGRGGTSRSSGVVHAALHHPDDWLKTRLARKGRAMLYAFCARHDVAVAKTGKWIVAVDETERAPLTHAKSRLSQLHISHQ